MKRKRVLVPLLLALVVLLGAGYWVQSPSGRDTIRRWRNPIAHEQVDAGSKPVLIIGDSIVAGVGAKDRAHSFAVELAHDERWDAEILGEVATGYAWPGLQGDTLDQLLVRARSKSPALVVLAVGTNDEKRQDPALVERVALTSLRAVEARWPSAAVVTVGPYQQQTAVEQAIADASREAHARHVRAIGWLTPALLESDRVHPTQRGHDLLAKRLSEAI